MLLKNHNIFTWYETQVYLPGIFYLMVHDSIHCQMQFCSFIKKSYNLFTILTWELGRTKFKLL